MAQRRHRVTLAGNAGSFEVVEGERILGAARRAGVTLPYECGWGSCGICKATLVEGETALLFEGAPARDARDDRRRRIILCQSTPISDVVIKPTSVLDGPPLGVPTVEVRCRLSSVEALSSEVSRFQFRADQPVAYRAGQYAVLQLGPDLRRCYSMSGRDQVELEFIAKRYPGGPGSGRLFELELGTEVMVEVPYGGMWLRPFGRPIFLIAGGTGISAILALVRELAASPGTAPVTVVYGAGLQADLVCADEIAALVSCIPGAELVLTLLDPPPGWAGQRGLVTDTLAGRAAELLDGETYLAGPPLMVDAVVSQLKGLGTPLDRVHYDKFG